MTTRYDLRHVRVDTYRAGEVFVTMTDLRYGWTASATANTEEEARRRCISDLEYRNDYECLKQGKRRLAEWSFLEYPEPTKGH